MTKNEILKELSKCDPSNIKSLYVIYHNKPNVKFTFSYEYTFSLSLDIRRELVKVILSIYNLRSYVSSILVVYFSKNGGCLTRTYDSCVCPQSISDFVKTIEKNNNHD